jgi:hypothetical protein
MHRQHFAQALSLTNFGENFAPGAIVADVARRAAICTGQIYRWRQELRHAGSGFSQVVIAAMDNGGNECAALRPGAGDRGRVWRCRSRAHRSVDAA